MNAWTGDVKATVGTFSVHPVEYTRYQSADVNEKKYQICQRAVAISSMVFWTKYIAIAPRRVQENKILRQGRLLYTKA